jgi:hypothetical protein
MGDTRGQTDCRDVVEPFPLGRYNRDHTHEANEPDSVADFQEHRSTYGDEHSPEWTHHRRIAGENSARERVDPKARNLHPS